MSVKRNITIGLVAVIVIASLSWNVTRYLYARWEGVPPVPHRPGALALALGDAQFAYRSGALTMQGLGDGGGRTPPLKDYDYNVLNQWFWLLHSLDPASNHVPMVAAYYFGATPVPSDSEIVARYLGVVGQIPVGNKWRWLAYAALLARDKAQNLPLALELSEALSRMNPVGDTLPPWARHMQVFMMRDLDEKARAREILSNILLTTPDMDKFEARFITDVLAEQLGASRVEVDELMRRRRDLGYTVSEPDPKRKELGPLMP